MADPEDQAGPSVRPFRVSGMPLCCVKYNLVAGEVYDPSQYCPVNLRGLGQKANSGGAFRVTWDVSDLNWK
jgi:hypothetical protein